MEKIAHEIKLVHLIVINTEMLGSLYTHVLDSGKTDSETLLQLEMIKFHMNKIEERIKSLIGES